MFRTALICYWGFTQAYAPFKVHKGALGSWTVRYLWCHNSKRMWESGRNSYPYLFFFFLKGVKHRGAHLPTPPTKPWKYWCQWCAQSVCTACTAAVSSTRSSCSRQEHLEKSPMWSLHRDLQQLLRFGDFTSCHWRRSREDTGCPSSCEYQGNQRQKTVETKLSLAPT